MRLPIFALIAAFLAGPVLAAPPPVQIAGLSYKHISTSTTTLVKSGAGFLHAVCVNTKGASSNIATVDDAVTATTPTIAVIDTTLGVGCETFDVAFIYGLTVVTATGTQADLTVSWR